MVLVAHGKKEFLRKKARKKAENSHTKGASELISMPQSRIVSDRRLRALCDSGDCMSNSRGDEWYTPKWLVEALGKFDLDPAAPRRSHWTATRCYTKEDDGLARPWVGRVFLNPPYSNPYPWVERLVEHGNAIALFFARTDTRWMQVALDAADGVFLLKGRIRFVDMDENQFHSATAPSLLLAFGDLNVSALRGAQVRNLICGKLLCGLRETGHAYGSKAVDGHRGAKLDFANLAAD